MGEERLEERWRQLCAEAITGMAEWRVQHPKAALSEIEHALDERLGNVRARMLEDAAMASQATDLRKVPAVDCPLCPRCGARLEHRTWEERSLNTHHGQTIRLGRSYAICPACGEALFPPR
jgi:NADH pyrophosphatase NudC (nudix superfamily)